MGAEDGDDLAADEWAAKSRPADASLLKWLVGCGGGCLIALFLCAIAMAWLAWTFGPAFDDSYRVDEARAEKFLAAGRFDEAKALFAKHEEWHRVGECEERAGRYEAALAAFDRAIGDGKWWPPYQLRAECMERHEGLAVATAWLENLRAREPEAVKFHRILGDFHAENGRPDLAVEPYRRAIEIVCRQERLAFDTSGTLLPDEQGVMDCSRRYAKLWFTLEALADCYWRLGRLDEAFVTATMGITNGVQVDRCGSYPTEAKTEAGNIDCRFLRVRILLAWGRPDEAAAELEHARAYASEGVMPAWKEEFATLEREVRRAR